MAAGPSRVTVLQPSPSLTDSHHVSPSTSYFASGYRYFRNPWPSYRPTTLNDAYLAYQKGAAVAPALEKPYESEVEALEDDRESLLPTRMAGVRVGDEEEDWRDPPVALKSPVWSEEGGSRGRVTWLGHAGAFVQLPTKGKRNSGILFDPIFSHRYA